MRNLITGIRERFKNNTFVKSVLTLSLGVVISQSVSLLATPILSRIYDPAIYGDFAILLSDANIFSVLVCLGMMTAILVPKEDDESKGVCRLLAKSVFLLSTLALIIVIAISPFYRLFEVGVDYWVACVLLWLYIVLSNLSNVLYGYVNRHKLYKVLLWNPAIGTVAKAVLCIGFGIIKPSFFFYATGSIASVLFVIFHMLRYTNPFKDTLPKEYSSRKVLISYKAFPLYQMPANLLDVISRQLPVQLLNKYFDSVILGSYSMCLSILGIPASFLATPVNRVYFQEATSRYNAGLDIGEFSYKILEKNIKIAIIPIMLLTIFGEWIFVFVLGEKWEMAGSFASILGSYQLVLFCSLCVSGNFVIIGKQRINLYLAILNIILNVVAFVLGYHVFHDIYHVLIFFALSGTIYKLFDIGLFLYYTGVSMSKFLGFVLKYLVLPVLLSIGIRLLIKCI